jgi:hypothetical protein
MHLDLDLNELMYEIVVRRGICRNGFVQGVVWAVKARPNSVADKV